MFNLGVNKISCFYCKVLKIQKISNHLIILYHKKDILVNLFVYFKNEFTGTSGVRITFR